MKQIPSEVVDIVETQVGHPLSFTFAGWPHAGSFVWRTTDRSGRVLYAKVHTSDQQVDQLVGAYKQIVPHLTCNVPEILRIDHPSRLALCSAIPGIPVKVAALESEEEEIAYRTAGAVARTMHEIPVGTIQSDDAGIRQVDTMRKAIDEARGYVDDEVLAWAALIGTDPSTFANEPIVHCHRDFSPRNWLVVPGDPAAGFGLIDFESARLDVRYADFWRMYADDWKERPERRDWFFAGYGRTLSEMEEERFRLFVLRNLLTTVPWAVEFDDPQFAAWARAAIAEMVRNAT